MLLLRVKCRLGCTPSVPEPKQNQRKRAMGQPRAAEREAMVVTKIELKLEQIQTKESQGQSQTANGIHEQPKISKREVILGDKAEVLSNFIFSQDTVAGKFKMDEIDF